jgi:hypothetical protein
MSERRPASLQSNRTLIYTGGLEPTVPAGVTAGAETVESAVGQIAVLTAVNMLARVHPGLVLAVPDAALLVPCPAGGATLVDACQRLAAAANPNVAVSACPRLPAGTLSIGIGGDSPAAAIHAGGARWTGTTGTSPQAMSPDPSSLLGAGMAVTLACGWIFRVAVGLPAVIERGVSLWTLAPASEPTGPGECGPVNIGSVWMVGAGAVGSCLAWWLHYVGVVGGWTIIDGDVADETNLNRSLGLFAAHAGMTGMPAVAKAIAAAELMPGAVPYPHWWDEWVESDPPSPDVLIPIANGRGVRPAVAAYGHPAVLHATTSRNWTCELHRHLLMADGCIACRLPEEAPQFECATARGDAATEDDPGRDAALPFLSAGAGLTLVAGLLQLQHGAWGSHGRNHWRLWFDGAQTELSSSRWRCERSCSTTPTVSVRRALHEHTRWSGLDPALGERRPQ